MQDIGTLTPTHKRKFWAVPGSKCTNLMHSDLELGDTYSEDARNWVVRFAMPVSLGLLKHCHSTDQVALTLQASGHPNFIEWLPPAQPGFSELQIDAPYRT